MASNAIRAAVERYFSEKYLFDAVNSVFRQSVSPKDAEGLSEPPFISCASILRFSDVSDVVTQSTNSSSENARIQAVVDALKESEVVVTAFRPLCHGSENSTGQEQWCLRRCTFLDPSHDPARRTIVLRPMPRGATMDEVAAFLQAYGQVESFHVVPQLGHTDDRHLCAYAVCMSTEEQAHAVATSHSSGTGLSFGKAETALAQRLLPPRVYATMLAAYEEGKAAARKRQEVKHLQSSILRAQTSLITLSEQQGTTGGSHQREGNIKRFLARGVTLKSEPIPESVTWQMVKMKLGNLAVKHASLKRGIELVTTEPASAQHPNRRAYVVCRNSQVAKEYLTCYNLEEGSFAEDLRQVCPNLQLLGEEEEVYVRQRYPAWCEPKVETKMAINRKRTRGT